LYPGSVTLTNIYFETQVTKNVLQQIPLVKKTFMAKHMSCYIY